LLFVELKWTLEIIEQTSAELLKLRSVPEPDMQDGKLVATEPGNRITLADMRPQPLAHRAEETITDIVAETIVDFLETIEVDVQHSGKPAVLRDVVDRAMQAIGQKRSVWQLG
jgi:hypothetical protein